MPTRPVETREALIQKAEHARRLAIRLAGDEAAERLRDYARELDARAAAMGWHEEGRLGVLDPNGVTNE